MITTAEMAATKSTRSRMSRGPTGDPTPGPNHSSVSESCALLYPYVTVDFRTAGSVVGTLGSDAVATQEWKVRRAAQRQGYSLVASLQDLGRYSLRDDFTTVVENQSLSYCEAWLATPVGGDVDATQQRLRGEVQ